MTRRTIFEYVNDQRVAKGDLGAICQLHDLINGHDFHGLFVYVGQSELFSMSYPNHYQVQLNCWQNMVRIGRNFGTASSSTLL